MSGSSEQWPPHPAHPGQGMRPTRYDRPDPRQDPRIPPETRVEPGRTARGEGSTPLHLLPTALRDRYVVTYQGDGGAEADILIAAERTAPDVPSVVVKIYRQDMRDAEDVWARLLGIEHPHLVRLLDAGRSDGRQYEVMEWIPGDPLARLITGRPWPLARATAAVGQLADALTALHDLGIVHRDVKPENIILRADAPAVHPHLVLIDFGLSRLDQEFAFTRQAFGTDHYLAPELLLRGGGASTPARDWWALGMIVRELLTGKRNFTELSTVSAMYEAVVLRPVQLDAITDPRARLLCRGLLTVDREDRWGAGQVREWLRGGSPEVVSAAHRQPELPPLGLSGRSFREGTDLALALRDPGFWKSLSRLLTAPPDDMELFDWLRALALQRRTPPKAVNRLVGSLADPKLAGDVKVLRLLHWLDPAGQPMWRGRSMGRDALTAVAQRAAGGAEEDVRLVDEVWRLRLLPEFARFAGSDSLSGADRTWQVHVGTHPAAVARVLPWIPAAHLQPPRGTPPPEPQAPDRVLAPLLDLALNPDVYADSLRGRLRRVFATEDTGDTGQLPTLPGTRPEEWQLHGFAPQWYTTVRRGEDADPVGLVVLRDYAPHAVADAKEERGRRHAALAAVQLRQAHWQERERQRMRGKARAQWRALFPTLGYALLLVLVGVVWAQAVEPAVAALVVPGFLVALVQVVREVRLAGTIAGEFGPEYRLFGRSGRGLQEAGRRSRGLFRGFLTLVTFLFVTVCLPLLWPVIALVHLVSLRRRRKRWERNYAMEHNRVLGLPS